MPALKILILKPSSLGDVIQALPVLRLIKDKHPHSEVHWWIDSRLQGLLEGDPQLAGLIPFRRSGWGGLRNWTEMWRTLRWARAQRFDWVIDLQCLARSGALAWLANGRLLVGLDERREGARGFYDSVARRASFHTHAVDWYLAVLPLLDVPVHRRFDWIPERPQAARAVRRTAGKPENWAAIIPGARWENKRWPLEHYAALMKKLRATCPDLCFAVLGGREDTPLGRELSAALNGQGCMDLTGRSTLPEMIEWIRFAQFVVTNDTGPMHVAAALDKPVIGLFGPTEPRRTGPYGQQDQALQLSLPCVPCMKSRCWHSPRMECLQALSADMVFARMWQSPRLSLALRSNAV